METMDIASNRMRMDDDTVEEYFYTGVPSEAKEFADRVRSHIDHVLMSTNLSSITPDDYWRASRDWDRYYDQLAEFDMSKTDYIPIPLSPFLSSLFEED